MLWNWTSAFDEVQSLRREMDNMLKRTHHYFNGSASQYPALNIYNHEDKVVVLAEVPGVKKADLEIEFADGRLTLKGERSLPDQGEQVVQLRHERHQGNFEKTVHIPLDINVDAIQAHLEAGILTLELPKAETARSKQIEIQ